MSEEPRAPEQQPPKQDRSIVYVAALFEGGLVGVAWLMGWAFDYLPLKTFQWNLFDFGLGVLITIPMLIVFYLLMRWPVGPFSHIKKLTDNLIRPLLRPCTTLDLLGISILAGLGEEMLFRGVLQPAFGDWLGSPWWGLLVASALFGLGHAITLTYAIFTFVMGLYLGWLWQWSGNLMTVALAHALYDFIALVIILRWEPAE